MHFPLSKHVPRLLLFTVSLVGFLSSSAIAQTPAPGDIVISQIYSGGGQVGSTFQNDYFELFNRTNAAIDIRGLPLSFTSDTGSFSFSVSIVGSNPVLISAGRYLLFRMGPPSANGAPLPVTPDFTIGQNLDLSGKIVFSRPGTVLGGSCPIPNSNVLDFVGYGSTANCFEGSGPTPTLSVTTAAIRQAGGCTDTDNNSSDFVTGSPTPRNSQSTPNFCSSAPPEIRFSQPNILGVEVFGSITVDVSRTGNTSGPSTVNYTTSDASGSNNCNVLSGSASARCDYISTIGTLSFAPFEQFKSITIPLINDSYAEGEENFSITLSNPTGATLGSPTAMTIGIADNESTNGINPIDQTDFFVRQHYLDFLNREPDNAGFNFWIGEINNCTPKPQCTEIKRINVSAAFFLSIEFQETGYLAYRMYKAAYGDTTSPNVAAPVPIIRLQEFLPDAQRVGRGVRVGMTGWEDLLESNKTAYAREFVVRPRFLAAYPSTMTSLEFVNQLNQNVGAGVLSQMERDQLVAELDAATDLTQARASVLRKVADDSDLRNLKGTERLC